MAIGVGRLAYTCSNWHYHRVLMCNTEYLNKVMLMLHVAGINRKLKETVEELMICMDYIFHFSDKRWFDACEPVIVVNL